MEKFKVIAFDVDGTLVSQNSSWITLHDHFQTNGKAKNHLQSYREGKIDYSVFMRWDIGLWPKPLHVDQIKPVLLTYSLMPNAKEIINKIKEKYEILLISAGIDILVEDVANNLGIKNFVSNGIEINKRGFVTGDGVFGVDLLKKEIALEKNLKKMGFSLDESIAVGDSIFDKGFLQAAGLGISIGASSELKEFADHSVDDLKDILSIV